MRPQEIVNSFGREGLDLLYEVMCEWTIRDLMDEVLMPMTERQVGEWLLKLRDDETEEELK